jgi:hypothetical protein
MGADEAVDKASFTRQLGERNRSLQDPAGRRLGSPDGGGCNAVQPPSRLHGRRRSQAWLCDLKSMET